MRELVEHRCPDLLAAATGRLAADPFDRLDDGTAYLQTAIFCASIAGLASVRGFEPAFYAGHSLGELSALVAAGSIDAHEGLDLVITRGRLMQRAADAGPPGGMLAVGTAASEGASLAEAFGLTLANDNSPEQIVLSGPLPAIRAARSEAKARGLRAFQLPIKGAFHSPAMASVVGEFRAALEAFEFRAPRAPVFSCAIAAPFDDVPARLAQSLVGAVRWREVVVALSERGATTFVEIGPGKALTGLIRRTLPGVDAHAVSEEELVDA